MRVARGLRASALNGFQCSQEIGIDWTGDEASKFLLDVFLRNSPVRFCIPQDENTFFAEAGDFESSIRFVTHVDPIRSDQQLECM